MKIFKVSYLLAGLLAAGGAFQNAHAIVITPTSDATTLTNNIVGSGVNVIGTPNYIGVDNQSGTFTGGNASGVGFDSGILMTTGNVNDVPGPNDNGPESVSGEEFVSDVNTAIESAGDTDLTAISGFETNDAAVLEFDFQFGDGTSGGDLFFNFVFASEEYIDYIDTEFNDVFGFLVDGVNVALVPGTSTPITINTVNNTDNSAYYRNNVSNSDGIPNLGLDLSFDGLTTVITAEALGLGAGTHTMKFAVADASDSLLDAGVFIQAGSFSDEPPQTTSVPEPGTLALLGIGLAGFGLARRRLRIDA